MANELEFTKRVEQTFERLDPPLVLEEKIFIVGLRLKLFVTDTDGVEHLVVNQMRPMTEEDAVKLEAHFTLSRTQAQAQVESIGEEITKLQNARESG